MNSINDFDRALGEWLDEGPNRAPDRPIELAVAHALAHPRRRDPLGFLRPDPMGLGSQSSHLPIRPMLVLAALGLLLGAIVALGVGGSRQPAVVVPPSPSQPASVSPRPTSGIASASTFVVQLTVPEGQPQTVAVSDRSGLIVEATTGTPESGQSFPSDAVEVTNLDATTLQLGWAGFPCQTDHTLTIESDGRTMTLERPACSGVTDSIGVDRILVLRFSAPVAAAAVSIALVP